jgi:type I restriction enzyme, S subunit
MVPLREVLVKSEDWIAIHPDQKYKEVTVRLWGKGATIRREVLGAEIASPTRLRVHTNQFIISRIDARNGASGLIPEDLEGAVVSNDFPVFIPNPTRLEPRFFGWLSKTKNFVELCKAASEGTTNRVRLKEDRFLATPISLPPLAEQRRLVERIDALAGKIGEAKKLRAEADAECSALISSLNSSMAGDRARKIGEVLELYEDRVAILAGAEYPQVGVKGFGGGLFARETLTANQTTYKSFNRLHDGNLVLSQVKGWEGAVAVCPSSLAGRFVSPEYRTFRCKDDELDPEYLAMIVPTEWFWGQLSTLTRGVGARRERIRPELFMELTVPMPCLADQRRGLEVCRRLRQTQFDKTKIPDQLNALLPAILDRAFRGEM